MSVLNAILVSLLIVDIIVPLINAAAETPVYMCNQEDTPASLIYCHGGEGSLLEAMLVKFPLFNDSKTFVDSPLRSNPDDIIAAWKNADKSNLEAVQQFYDQHFSPPTDGSDPSVELDDCNPPDWKESPKFLNSVQDGKYKLWAKSLNGYWKKLCRKIKPGVRLNPNRTSLIMVPHNFVVPGGRFREFYYWDTYWILKGLITSEMYDTAEGMIRNFATMVNRYGFVPNGGRIYYLRRSQPPLLIPMVYDLYKASGKVDLLTDPIGPNQPRLIDILVKEFEFWQKNRAVQVPGSDGNPVEAYQYRAVSNTPRPESYDKDVTTATNTTEDQKPLKYRNLASAAESGWDFSTRWFRDGKNLETIQTTNVVPVELNAYLCRNARLLALFMNATGDQAKASTFAKSHADLVSMVKSVFWNSTAGTWFDYNLGTKRHNNGFYASSLVPLYTDCIPAAEKPAVSNKVHNWFKASGAMDYLNGVPTSLIHSEQQWDFPNGWPPLNHMAIMGLHMSGVLQLQEAAFQLAQKWTAVNFKVFQTTSHMFEKYDVQNGSCAAGHGGEYNVQTGFGWTNGVILDLLKTFGDRLTAPTTTCSEGTSVHNLKIHWMVIATAGTILTKLLFN